MRCHLAGTLVWSQATMFQTDSTGSPTGRLGAGTPVRSDVAYRQITFALVNQSVNESLLFQEARNLKEKHMQDRQIPPDK